MSKNKFYLIAAMFIVSIMVLSVFSSAASATMIKYNRDYNGIGYQDAEYPDPPHEPEEPYTAIFTDLRTGDSAVPSNSAVDLANGLTPTVIFGSVHSASGATTVLTDGVMASNRDSASESFFFNNYIVGKLGFDLGSIQPIGQINTYSWHVYLNDGRRSMQKHDVYASDGTAVGFDANDYTSPGWTLLAQVNCHDNYGVWGDGQYGVSVQPDSGVSLGNYRYFIFEIASPGAPAGAHDQPFYQEIDIVKAVPEPSTLALLATGLIGLLAYAWKKRK